MTDLLVRTWIDVCSIDDLVIGRGACVLVGGCQVALFRIADAEVYAISNFDPFSEAYVLSRGIVGSRGDVPKVSSPMYKQSFALRTGVCLDEPDVAVATFEVRLRDGRIEVLQP
jgi:nitrite reductase (NADH) small subunit